MLVVGCEVATLHFNEDITDGSQMVAHSLFSDGAGAFIISTKGEWKLADSGMCLIPDSTHLLAMEPHGRVGKPR